MDTTARWIELVDRPEDEVPLDEAALTISACANPLLDVDVALRRLDALAGKVEPADTEGLCRLLFVEMGLRGDRECYDDPRNSYIDQVLGRRLGIPISLSVILIEVGRRVGVELQAVGMPGHFLVGDPAAPLQYIDAFNQGHRLDRSGCQGLLEATTGRGTLLTDEMLAPIGTHAVLARMLANLDRSFELRNDREGLAWVSELRAHIPEAPVGDRMQLAARMAVLGRFDAAASVLEGAAEDTEDPGRVLDQAEGLRARLN